MATEQTLDREILSDHKLLALRRYFLKFHTYISINKRGTPVPSDSTKFYSDWFTSDYGGITGVDEWADQMTLYLSSDEQGKLDRTSPLFWLWKFSNLRASVIFDLEEVDGELRTKAFIPGKTTKGESPPITVYLGTEAYAEFLEKYNMLGRIYGGEEIHRSGHPDYLHCAQAELLAKHHRKREGTILKSKQGVNALILLHTGHLRIKFLTEQMGYTIPLVRIDPEEKALEKILDFFSEHFTKDYVQVASTFPSVSFVDGEKTEEEFRSFLEQNKIRHYIDTNTRIVL